MRDMVARVLRVGAWAEVELNPGMEREARRALTLQPSGTEKLIAQYRKHPTFPNRLFIPRALVAKSGLDVEGHELWDRVVFPSNIKYRDGQEETIESFMQALAERQSPYGGIMQAVTGAGKTVMAIDVMRRIGLRTLIVVPRTSLVEQWRDRIKQYTGLKDSDIGLVQGQNWDYNKPVVIAMIHTLAQQLGNFPKQFYRMFGFVIFDECHTVGAETFSLTAPMFRSKYRMGLSATPRRSDGMDRVFYWHLGPITARYTKLQAQARIRILPYVGSDTDHAGLIWGGNLNLGRYLNRIARSTGRMDFLTRIVSALDSKGHDILVLSDRINHLNMLRFKLLARGVDDSKIGFLTGSVKQLDRKIILGTYGSAGMGVDIPRLTALVLATPRADIEQAVGRVLRQGSPIVIDLVDVTSKIMLGWAGARMKFYRKITANIQDRTRAA